MGPFRRVDAVAVLDGVRKYFDNSTRIDGETVTIVAAGIAPDGSVVVVYRAQDGRPIQGLHIDLDRFAAIFDPVSGELRDVDSADHPVDEPRGILWQSV